MQVMGSSLRHLVFFALKMLFIRVPSSAKIGKSSLRQTGIWNNSMTLFHHFNAESVKWTGLTLNMEISIVNFRDIRLEICAGQPRAQSLTRVYGCVGLPCSALVAKLFCYCHQHPQFHLNNSQNMDGWTDRHTNTSFFYFATTQKQCLICCLDIVLQRISSKRLKKTI